MSENSLGDADSFIKQQTSHCCEHFKSSIVRPSVRYQEKSGKRQGKIYKSQVFERPSRSLAFPYSFPFHMPPSPSPEQNFIFCPSQVAYYLRTPNMISQQTLFLKITLSVMSIFTMDDGEVFSYPTPKSSAQRNEEEKELPVPGQSVCWFSQATSSASTPFWMVC